jgi:hypothetical protein
LGRPSGHSLDASKPVRRRPPLQVACSLPAAGLTLPPAMPASGEPLPARHGKCGVTAGTARQSPNPIFFAGNAGNFTSRQFAVCRHASLVSPSHPSPRKSTPTRMKPSRAVSYTADTRHRALEGALLLSEGSSLSPGKRLHHQRSSSSHDASPHPQGERPAPVAGKFSDIGYGIVGQRRCRTRKATRRQIHQWGCRAPRLCERERRGSSKFGRSGPRYPPPSAAHSSFGTY